jgi:hypothetical protein
MGDRLGNTAAAEPVDGVSVWHLIADGLRHAAGQRSSDITARTALSQRTHVLSQTLKTSTPSVGPNDLYVLMGR